MAALYSPVKSTFTLLMRTMRTLPPPKDSPRKKTAHLVAQRNGVYVKFRWEDESPSTYFEMRISYNELTRENTLEVTDFADKDEIEDQKELWNSQIENLRRQSGM